MATDSAYVLAAGDIANGTSATSRWAQTGKLLDGYQDIVSNLYILPLGDNAYNDGTLTEFNNYFDPYWGVGGTQSGYTWKNKYSNLYPVPGNHEARLSSTYAGYESYFGSRAYAAQSYHWTQEITHADGSKYWRVIGLDSNVMSNAAQITYLRARLLEALTAGPGGTAQHVIITFHHPLWTPGGYSPGIAAIGGTSTNGAAAAGIIGAIQDPLYQGNIKIILNGHDHLYARYNPLRAGTYSTTTRTFAQSPSTVALGFTEILCGMGGNAPDALAAGANLSNVAHYHAKTSTDADGGSGILAMDLRNDSAVCKYITIDNTATGFTEESFTIALTSVPPIASGDLKEMPETTPRFWDTTFANITGSPLRHEGRPQTTQKVTGNSTLWVGGNFNRVTDISGAPAIDYTRNNLASYNMATGNLNTWNPDSNGQVLDSALSADESLLFVVGEFTAIGSSVRNYIAAFDTATGDLNTSYFSGFACNGPIDSCVIDGTSLYVGGRFTTIGGSSRNRAAKLSVATSTVTVNGTWNPNLSQPPVCMDLAIDSGTHKIALNLDPQGSVNGTGTHSIALVNATDGTKYWGANPNGGGGYVMWVNDAHNAGQLYFGSRGTGGNILFAYSYAGVQQWWYDGNGDVQGGCNYRDLLVVCKHDNSIAPAKNISWTGLPGVGNGVYAEGIFLLNKDGALQAAPWRSRFKQSDSTLFSSLRTFGAHAFVETAVAYLVVTGEFGSVSNWADTQSKAAWRLAQFNESGTTTEPGSHGWSIGYWDGDYWGSTAGAGQDASVTSPAGAWSFAGTAPAVSATFGGSDALVVAPAGAFLFICATPDVEAVAPVTITAPAGAFRFAGGGHGVTITDTTIILHRPKRFRSLDEDVQQGKVVR